MIPTSETSRRPEARHFVLAAILAAGAGCDGGAPPDPIDDGTIPFTEDADPPACADEEITAVIDVHEHVFGEAGLAALTAVVPEAGIDEVVAFPMLENRYAANALLLDAAAASDGWLVPFVAVDVHDPGAAAYVEQALAAGAAGLKLFSGHGEVHGDTPLDSPLAEPIYDLLESTRTPLLMHVNGGLYLDELERVLDAHPELIMICPHWCLLTHDPGRLAQLLDDHPNLSVDLSFGRLEAAMVGFERLSNDIELWRRFVRVYVDRITFGSDTVFYDEVYNQQYLADMRSYLDFVSADSFAYRAFQYDGLAADACTRKHILQHNAERFLAGLPPERAP